MPHPLRRELELALLINNEVTGHFGARERLFLQKKSGESMRHVLMKLLSFILYYEPGLEVEVSAGQRHKPDLLAVDTNGEPTLWIDCGTTGLPKLARITQKNPQTRFVIVKPNPRELELYRHEALRLLDPRAPVEYMAPRPGLIEELDELLWGRHEVVATVTPERGHLYLTIDGRDVNTPVTVLGGAAGKEEDEGPDVDG